jgi:hypothetical protein
MTSAPALLLALALLTLPAPAQESSGPTDAEREGHARMVALLAEVHAKTTALDPFLGDGELPRLERQIAAHPEGIRRKQLAQRLHHRGVELLRLGRNADAVESMLRAHELLADVTEGPRPRFERALLYDLGVANMRQGEVDNCVARHTSRSCILPIEGDGVHVDQTGSRAAMKWFREALAGSQPGESIHVAARWLLNVTAMTVGEHPDALAEEERVDFTAFAGASEFPRFVDVAHELGLAVFDHSGGAVVDDLDGDGTLDVFTSSWDTQGELRVFLNRGDGTFEDATQRAGLDGIHGGLNLVQADYDDDGDVDVLVLRGAWRFGIAGKHPNSLLRNEGDGTFVDVTFLAGLGEDHFPTQTGAWGDYDLDGDLDLYVGNEATPNHRFASQLFRNEGDGSFVDVAREAGVTNLRYAKGVVWGDYDRDGDPDLYVSNLDADNRLYRNEGDGTFVDVAAELGVAQPRNSFPVWFWDYDNDGWLDLFVSSYDKGDSWAEYRLTTVAASYAPDVRERFGSPPPRLYRGDGKGGFEDVAAAAGVARATLPMSGNFGDLDNDGFLDFYLGTGYPYFDGLIPNVMFRGVGGRSFEDVTIAGGFGHLQKGHGIAFCDLDDDGDQDVFEQMGGAFPGDAFGNALFENPGFGNHWLRVRLVGTESNRSAIGAHVRADLTEGEAHRSVHRHVTSGGSFGANPLEQHLGLGSATSVDVLEVTWPRTGRTQTFRDVAADQRIVITEGTDAIEVVPLRASELGG